MLYSDTSELNFFPVFWLLLRFYYLKLGFIDLWVLSYTYLFRTYFLPLPFVSWLELFIFNKLYNLVNYYVIFIWEFKKKIKKNVNFDKYLPIVASDFVSFNGIWEKRYFNDCWTYHLLNNILQTFVYIILL